LFFASFTNIQQQQYCDSFKTLMFVLAMAFAIITATAAAHFSRRAEFGVSMGEAVCKVLYHYPAQHKCQHQPNGD
jgi:predicted outer membrane lipoprotein